MLNEQELNDELDLLANAPPGTCLELRPGFWLVRGSTKSYGVNERAGTCGCPHFQHRHVKCWHLAALAQFVGSGEKTCPLCKGEGCCSCDEKGRVSEEEYAVLLDIKQAQDQARQEALRKIFA